MADNNLNEKIVDAVNEHLKDVPWWAKWSVFMGIILFAFDKSSGGNFLATIGDVFVGVAAYLAGAGKRTGRKILAGLGQIANWTQTRTEALINNVQNHFNDQRRQAIRNFVLAYFGAAIGYVTLGIFGLIYSPSPAMTVIFIIMVIVLGILLLMFCHTNVIISQLYNNRLTFFRAITLFISFFLLVMLLTGIGAYKTSYIIGWLMLLLPLIIMLRVFHNIRNIRHDEKTEVFGGAYKTSCLLLSFVIMMGCLIFMPGAWPFFGLLTLVYGIIFFAAAINKPSSGIGAVQMATGTLGIVMILWAIMFASSHIEFAPGSNSWLKSTGTWLRAKTMAGSTFIDDRGKINKVIADEYKNIPERKVTEAHKMLNTSMDFNNPLTTLTPGTKVIAKLDDTKRDNFGMEYVLVRAVVMGEKKLEGYFPLRYLEVADEESNSPQSYIPPVDNFPPFPVPLEDLVTKVVSPGNWEVILPAKVGNGHSGIYLKPGESVVLSAEGKVTTETIKGKLTSLLWTGPEGRTENNEWRVGRTNHGNWQRPGLECWNIGAVYCRVGSNALWEFIGKGGTITNRTSETQEIFLAVCGDFLTNDGVYQPDWFQNNSGAFKIKIKKGE